MWYGPFRGEYLINIPPEHLLKLYKKPTTCAELKKYVEENMDHILKSLNKKNKFGKFKRTKRTSQIR